MQADLQVTKGVSTNSAGPYGSSLSVVAGQLIYFQIGIANNGPNIASNVVINDLLPPGLTLVTNISGGYNYNTNTGVWTIGTVYPNSGTGYVYLDAIGTNAGLFTNTATVPVPNGVTDPNLTNNSANAVAKIYQVYSVSGYVRGCQTNASGVAFTTVNLTGAATGSTLSGTNGFFSFSNLLSGSYTVTPTQPGNTFTPASATVTLSANTTLPVFLGAVGQIRGQLSYGSNGAVIAGALVALSGPTNRTMLTDANGVYAFTNTPPGNYTITPIATNGYAFTPTNAVVVISVTNCTGQASFNASKTRVVQLVALEVVQVSQDWSNSVPLIQAKKTYVRAFLQLPTNGPAVLVQGARLYGTGAGGALPGSPLPPYAPNRSPDLVVQTTNAGALRGILTSNLNFELPDSWPTGMVSLQFVCTNNLTVIPTNTVPANSTVQVTFNPVPAMPVKFAGYNWNNAGVVQNVNADAYADLPKRLVSIYPVPDRLTLAKMKQLPPINLAVPAAMPPGVTKLGRWVLFNSNAKLVQMQTFDQMLGGLFGDGTNWIYYGAIASPSPDASGWAKTYVTSGNTISANATFVSSGFVDAAFYTTDRHTHSHEIGHNLGRPHSIINSVTLKGACGEGAGAGTPVFAFCQPVPPPAGPIKPALGPMTNGVNAMVYGLDTLTLLSATNLNPVADPNMYFDVMSYCDVVPLDVWNSSATYKAMLASVTNLFRAPPPPPPPGPVRKWFLMRGYVNTFSNVAGLFPFWTVSTTATNPPAASGAGTYYALLLDGSGNLIQEISFAPDAFVLEDDPDETGFGMFELSVPADPAIRSVQIWNGENMTQLAAVTGSSNLPSVTAISLTDTNGGAFTGAGPLMVSWSASDADPNAQLAYTVQYSPDGGATWETLDTDLPGNSYTIDSAYLHASTDGIITVSVSDGFNSSDPAPSTTFTVQNHAPVINLSSPMNGTIFMADEQVVLDAFVNDPQDGLLDDASVQWVSSLDGPLGSGAELDFEASVLSEGMHLITVTATDSEGLTNSASVQIYVLRQSPPELAIQYNGGQIQVSWPSSYTNYVLEASLSLAPSSWTLVTNAPVAADITQTVNLKLSNTDRFFRLLMP
jgi:uncharacterized repeat protein (TIGR01451 family)